MNLIETKYGDLVNLDKIVSVSIVQVLNGEDVHYEIRAEMDKSSFVLLDDIHPWIPVDEAHDRVLVDDAKDYALEQAQSKMDRFKELLKRNDFIIFTFKH